MNKRILLLLSYLITFIIFFIGMIGTVHSANINLNSYVYKEYTILNYIITFTENETFTLFSVQIPKDSDISYVVDKNGPIKYEIRENWLYLKSNNKTNKVILLKIRTRTLSNEIEKTDTFKLIQNFGTKIDNFNLKVSLEDDFGKIIDLFPENYSIINNEIIEWNRKNFGNNGLFIINFKKKEENINPTNISKDSKKDNKGTIFFIRENIYLIILLLTILVLIIILLFFVLYPKYLKDYIIKTFTSSKKKELKRDTEDRTIENEYEPELDNDSNNEAVVETSINLNLDKNIEINLNNGPKSENKHKEKDKCYKEENSQNPEKKEQNKSDENNDEYIKKEDELMKIIEKHLTENEKSVVKVVRENEGILQQNILDYIPSMTSSNLSKIIKKLHSKRILNRIRVGKVNKIYLGEKLKKEE